MTPAWPPTTQVDTFSHESAKGFIALWGLPVEVRTQA